MDDVIIEHVDTRWKLMRNRERTEQFMWRIALDDLDRMLSYQTKLNEPHWVTTRFILNKMEDLQLELKESQDKVTRVRNRLENISQDMFSILETLIATGEEELVERMELSDDTKRLINFTKARPTAYDIKPRRYEDSNT